MLCAPRTHRPLASPPPRIRTPGRVKSAMYALAYRVASIVTPEAEQPRRLRQMTTESGTARTSWPTQAVTILPVHRRQHDLTPRSPAPAA